MAPVTVSLLNASIESASKVILGDILGYNYTVAPALSGSITIETPKAVTRAEIIQLFQDALGANGCTVVRVGQSYRVDHIDQGKTTYNGIEVGNSAVSAERFGNGLRVVPLKYVSASEMRTILEPMFGNSAIVGADDARNTITVAGSSQDISNVLDAIAVFDIDIMKGMSFAVIPVTSVRPTAISDELKNVFASSGTKGMIRFVPNDRLKTILVVSPQRDYLARATGWIRRLDSTAQGQEKRLFTYKVQNRSAKELAGIVNHILAPDRASGASNGEVAPRFERSEVESAQLDPKEDAGTSSVETNAASADLEGDGLRITADESNNALLALCSPTDYKKLLQVLQDIDVSPRQVMIEATILEVSLNDQMKFGVRWYFQNHDSGFLFSNLAGKAISATSPGFSYAFQSLNIQAAIDALNSVTHVNVLSAPSLMVLDNRTAKLQIGDQVPVVTQSATGVQNSDSPIVNSVTYRDTGVILQLTPRINDNGRVLLDITQEVSSVAATTSSGIDSPTIKQRRIETSVIVDDGQSLALGGIIQKQRDRGENKVPLLGDIPILGTAFRSKNDGIQKTELMIFITPRVVRDARESIDATAEYRARLGFPAGQARGGAKALMMEQNAQRIAY